MDRCCCLPLTGDEGTACPAGTAVFGALGCAVGVSRAAAPSTQCMQHLGQGRVSHGGGTQQQQQVGGTGQVGQQVGGYCCHPLQLLRQPALPPVPVALNRDGKATVSLWERVGVRCGSCRWATKGARLLQACATAMQASPPPTLRRSPRDKAWSPHELHKLRMSPPSSKKHLKMETSSLSSGRAMMARPRVSLLATSSALHVP